MTGWGEVRRDGVRGSIADEGHGTGLGHCWRWRVDGAVFEKAADVEE